MPDNEKRLTGAILDPTTVADPRTKGPAQANSSLYRLALLPVTTLACASLAPDNGRPISSTVRRQAARFSFWPYFSVVARIHAPTVTAAVSVRQLSFQWCQPRLFRSLLSFQSCSESARNRTSFVSQAESSQWSECWGHKRQRARNRTAGNRRRFIECPRESGHARQRAGQRLVVRACLLTRRCTCRSCPGRELADASFPTYARRKLA